MVESLTLGYTLLKTDDNRRVVVPTASWPAKPHQPDRERPAYNLLSADRISYDSDIDKARGILLDLAGKHPKAKEVCGCPLTQLSSSGVVLTLMCGALML